VTACNSSESIRKSFNPVNACNCSVKQGPPCFEFKNPKHKENICIYRGLIASDELHTPQIMVMLVKSQPFDSENVQKNN
jgi:hypothetical protein